MHQEQLRLEIPFERRQLIAELKACSNRRDLRKGSILHEAAVESGNASNIYVASILINMYSKCGSMEAARRVFDKLCFPDVVCWTALILGYADNGEAEVALKVFSQMRGCTPDARTFVAISVACSNLIVKDPEMAKAMHLLAWRMGYGLDLYVQNALVDLYAKCGEMQDALAVFGSILHPDVISWTALILGYVDCGQSDQSLEVFIQMKCRGCTPNARTFVAVIKACASIAANMGNENVAFEARGKEMHLLVQTHGCDSDVYVQGVLVDMYAKCGSMKNARIVFDDMKNPDVVSWTALIFGYVDNEESETALSMFSKMRHAGFAQDAGCFIAAAKACAELAEKGAAVTKLPHLLYLLILSNGHDSDVYMVSSLIDMYGKCENLREAQRVFDNAKLLNTICWNSLIFGYATNGYSEMALDFYSRMKSEGFALDSGTFVAVLRACVMLGALEIGRSIHGEICACGMGHEQTLRNCLVEFYTKCGSLKEAEQLFDSRSDRDAWNALIAGYSRIGDTGSALSLFDKMCDTGIRPNGITFKCILTVCAHTGLVDVGKFHFDAMAKSYGIIADIEHYNCMIDILGRANKLEDAMVMLRIMPCSPDVVTWTIILAACNKWKNVKLGKLAFESNTWLDEEETGAYALMANVY